MTSVAIARLAAADAPAYRALMLEAYTQAADAFTSTAEERAVAPLTWWEDRIHQADGLSWGVGAFLEGQLAGAVALEFSAKPKTCHSVLVVGMYVRPAARRCGVGAALIAAAVDSARARPGIEVMRLTVTEGNAPALRLYAAAGFEAWGVEPLAIRTPGGLRGKVHMALRL